jgi:3-hydroxyisobutyrate dehydrogenase-like beta-hydroxyacid dehydrogenase
MVSGPPTVCEELRPIFEVIGRYFYIGSKPGMGQLMKLANNMLSATAMAASAEVVVMGVKAGLDPQVMIEVINAGTGANTAIRDKFPRTILTRRFDSGFATGLMYKDIISTSRRLNSCKHRHGYAVRCTNSGRKPTNSLVLIPTSPGSSN